MSFFHRHRQNRNRVYLLIPVLIFLALLACRPGQPAQTPVFTPTPEQPPIVETPTVEQPVATFTPTPASAQVILIALPGSDAAALAELQEVLTGLAEQDGLSFEVVTEPERIQISSETQLVTALPPDPGIVDLAAENPAVQFLAIGIPEVQVAPNLSIIGSGGERVDQQGFLAGYLAAVISPDWRVGVVSQPDSPAGLAASNGFANGVVFFCGLCRPAYPPFIQYPIFVDLQAGGDPQAVVDTLVGNTVKTVYVAPGAGDAALFDALAQAGLQLIGSGEPSQQISSQWVASIQTDSMGALRQIWPRLLAGEGGFDLSTPLSLDKRNPALVSPGRQRLVDRVLTDLLAGYIDSGVDPQTGEMR